MIKELKKCHVCGDMPELITSQPFSWCDRIYYVRCSNPDCNEQTPYFDTEEEACVCWNNRAEESGYFWCGLHNHPARRSGFCAWIDPVDEDEGEEKDEDGYEPDRAIKLCRDCAYCNECAYASEWSRACVEFNEKEPTTWRGIVRKNGGTLEPIEPPPPVDDNEEEQA